MTMSNSEKSAINGDISMVSLSSNDIDALPAKQNSRISSAPYPEASVDGKEEEIGLPISNGISPPAQECPPEIPEWHKRQLDLRTFSVPAITQSVGRYLLVTDLRSHPKKPRRIRRKRRSLTGIELLEFARIFVPINPAIRAKIEEESKTLETNQLTQDGKAMGSGALVGLQDYASSSSEYETDPEPETVVQTESKSLDLIDQRNKVMCRMRNSEKLRSPGRIETRRRSRCRRHSRSKSRQRPRRSRSRRSRSRSRRSQSKSRRNRSRYRSRSRSRHESSRRRYRSRSHHRSAKSKSRSRSRTRRGSRSRYRSKSRSRTTSNGRHYRRQSPASRRKESRSLSSSGPSDSCDTITLD